MGANRRGGAQRRIRVSERLDYKWPRLLETRIDVADYFGRSGNGATSVAGNVPKTAEVPMPEAAVVCNNCSARSNNDKLELGGG